MPKIQSKYRCIYLERNQAALKIRMGVLPTSELLIINPGDIVINKKKLTADDCEGNAERATQINKYIQRLVNEGVAKWERIPSEEDQRVLSELNDNETIDDTDGDNDGNLQLKSDTTKD